jgi:hypothetical protein
VRKELNLSFAGLYLALCKRSLTSALHGEVRDVVCHINSKNRDVYRHTHGYILQVCVFYRPHINLFTWAVKPQDDSIFIYFSVGGPG